MKLEQHEIHVWLAFDREIDQPDLLRDWEVLLTPEERARRDRLRAPHLPRQYLVTRALLRLLLSGYAPHTAPTQWRFAVGDHGKPVLAPMFEANGLHFNVAHTAGLVAIALAREPVLGVDVEHITARAPPLHVAPRFFTEQEAEGLAQLPAHQRPERFYALWTLKESWLKATGEGLAGGLDQVSFHFADTRFGAAVTLLGDDAARWHFWQAAPSAEHLLALALRSGLERPQVSMLRLEAGAGLRGTPLAAPRLVGPASDEEQRPET